MKVLAPDRLAEFKNYYEEDSKRKGMSAVTYRIRDFVRRIRPVKAPFSLHDDTFFDAPEATVGLFQTQTFILESLSSRIDGIIAELESAIAYGIQDAEIESAEALKKLTSEHQEQLRV